MILKIKNLSFNLQLLAEGAGDGGTSGEASGVNANAADLQKGVNRNPLADVQYGKQAEPEAQAANVQEAESISPEDRSAAFEALIKGEYKDLYDAKVQDTIQKRLKGSKDIVDKYNALTPTLEMLGKKYGVNATDIEALNKAIEDDDAYYEEEAIEKGVTVEQLKQIKKMERENADLKRQMDEKANQERAERDVAMWLEQAKEASKTFPGLNLGEELKNPQFLGLLRSGIDVSTAYFAIHNKELVPQAMQYTAKQVEQKLTNKILSSGARPQENGVSGQSSAVTKSDVSQLTKADRQEIARRVARGERITF